MYVSTYFLTVVSVEKEIFIGAVNKIRIMGIEGELEVFPRHTPLLTCIKPGVLHIFKKDDSLEYIYLSGGILEVQSNMVTILADTAIRAEELDEEQARTAKNKVKAHFSKLRYDDIDYMKVSLEMSQALAKLRLFELAKNSHYV